MRSSQNAAQMTLSSGCQLFVFHVWGYGQRDMVATDVSALEVKFTSPSQGGAGFYGLHKGSRHEARAEWSQSRGSGWGFCFAVAGRVETADVGGGFVESFS